MKRNFEVLNVYFIMFKNQLTLKYVKFKERKNDTTVVQVVKQLWYFKIFSVSFIMFRNQLIINYVSRFKERMNERK